MKPPVSRRGILTCTTIERQARVSQACNTRDIRRQEGFCVRGAEDGGGGNACSSGIFSHVKPMKHMPERIRMKMMKMFLYLS